MVPQRFCPLIENLIEGVLFCDKELIINEVNTTFVHCLGYDRKEDLIGKKITQIVHKDFHSRILDLDHSSPNTLYELRLLHVDGRSIWCAFRLRRYREGYLLMFLNIDELKKHEQRLYTLLNYDTLTQLPNRSFFLDFIKLKIEEYERLGRFAALLFVDIDNFTVINDLYGYKVGDRVLTIVAKRLQKGVRRHDFVARVGGDEFLIFLDLRAGSYDEAVRLARNIAHQIQKKIEKRIFIGTIKLTITASVGIAIVDGHLQLDGVMRQADLAIFKARRGRNSQITIFDEGIQEEIEKRILLYEQIQEGISRNEFYLLFQPKVELASQRIVGFEALLRWKHGERVIPPLEFVPIAEESGLIVELGEFVIHRCCEYVAKGMLHQVAINISPLHFEERDFVARVQNIVKNSGIDPRALIFEITENMLIKDMDVALEKMQLLSEYGIRFSIDDFGTGFSSFAYLKTLPLYELKIDRIFINDMLKSPNDRSVVEAIVQIAKIYDLVTTAEGVERQEEVETLQTIGANFAQGFYYYPPLSIDEIRRLDAVSKT